MSRGIARWTWKDSTEKVVRMWQGLFKGATSSRTFEINRTSTSSRLLTTGSDSSLKRDPSRLLSRVACPDEETRKEEGLQEGCGVRPALLQLRCGNGQARPVLWGVMHAGSLLRQVCPERPAAGPR